MSPSIDVPAVRARLADRLGEEAFDHCVSVGTTARDIARVYGVDETDAYVAGLLHDWAREHSARDLLAAAESFGIETTATDRAVPYLLHARVGARLVAEAFPQLTDDVIAAVAAHTLGDAEMSDLARVVFIADMIEPARTTAGVDELRASVGEVALGELFARAYALSITSIVAGRRQLHPRTVAVWNAVVGGGDE